MKTIKYSLLAVAAMAAISCAKDIAPESDNNVNPNLVQVTLTASGESETDTKAVFSSYPKIAWEGNEEISLLGLKTRNQKLTANGKGHQTTFTGYADVTDDVYYAVYPYDANVTLNENGTIANVTLPAVQKATAGSFDPKAYIAVAESTDKENLHFKAVGGFVKFKLSDAESVKSVTMISNAGSNMACTGTVSFSGTGVAHGGPYVNSSSSIKMVGPFETDKAYFMVVRPQPYTGGVTIYIEYNDGTVLARKGESALFESGKGRNYIRDLGTLKKADFSKLTDSFSLYNLGYDVVIANMTINKETHGEATLITDDSENKAIGDKGVYFVDGSAEGVTIAGNAAQLVVLSLDEKMATIGRTAAKSLYINASAENDYFVLSNVKYVTDMTSGNMFGISGDGDVESIYFHKCAIEVPSDMNMLYGAMNILNFNMTDCDVRLHNGTAAKNIVQTNTENTYETLVFKNNIFYSTDGDLTNFRLFSNSKATIASLEFRNNTVAGVYCNAAYGYVTVKSIKAGDVVSNLLYLPDYTTHLDGKYVGILHIADKVDAHLNMPSNLAFYNYDAVPDYRAKVSYYSSNGTIYNKAKADNPIPSPDYVNGVFTQGENYKSFGAKR